MEYKEDLRIVRTRKLLSSTLIDMMQEESLEKISVIDLCNRAMVNRATFYAHFEDKYHLLTFALEELKDEIYDNFSCDFEVNCTREMLRKLAHAGMKFVTVEKNHVSDMLKYNRNEKVIRTIKESLVSSVKYQLAKFKEQRTDTIPYTLIAICFTGALVDLCIWYIDNMDKYTHAELSDYMDRLIDKLA